MNFYLTFLIVCIYLMSGIAVGRDIVIVGTIDREAPNYPSYIRSGMDYIQDRDMSGFLKNDKLEYTAIMTRDNNSFAAMDKVCQVLGEGIDVILDVSSRYVTATMRSLSEALGIPHLSSVDPAVYDLNQDQQHQTSVNIEPPSSTMLLAVRDLVSQENLTNVGIVYDKTFDLDNKPKRLLRNIPAQHLYLRMADTESTIRAQLDKIKGAELNYVFLACSSDNANRYLGLANDMGMMSFKFSWYVITQDTKVGCSKCQTDSSVVVMTGRTSYQPMLRYVDYMNQKIQTHNLNFNRDNIEMSAAFFFDLANILGQTLNILVTSGEWKKIAYTDCFQFTDTDPAALAQAELFKNTIQQIGYTGVFGPFHWIGNVSRQDITLDIKRVNFQGGTLLNEQMIGNWSTKTHLHAFSGVITNKKIRKTYRVITLKEPPFVFKTKDLPESVITDNKYYYFNSTSGYYYYGYCIDLIFNINNTGSMQFDFILVEPADGAYGTMQPNNTWNGMINDLIQDRADIIVAPLSVMAERENVIDFTVPYYDLVGITILMKKITFTYSVFKFMSVLEDAVWGCVFSAFIIVSVLLAVFDKFSPYSYQNNKEAWDGQGAEPRVFTLKEGLWFCMTSLTPQGGGEAPKALSGRLVAATWWMFGFIMIATYTANLAAFLTVSRLDQPIESLDDLAKQFKTKYGPQESTSTETYFRRMADIEAKFYTIWKSMSLNDSLDQVERAKLAVWDYPVSDKFTNMWHSMSESGFPKSFEAAIERIKHGKEEFAFIGDATQNKYATLTDCELTEVGEEFSRKPYALAVQEGSPLKSDLSSVILQLLNQRVLEDLKTYWWDFNRTECQKVESESDGISIYNIGGVFLVIFIGIGLGLITLGFEYYWYRARPGAKRKAEKRRRAAHDDKQNGVHVQGQNGNDNTGYDAQST